MEIGTIRAVVAVFDMKFVSIAQIIKIIIISAVGEGLSPSFDTIELAIKSPVPVSFRADASASDPTYNRIVFKAMGTSWKTCCCYGGHPIAEEKKSILGNHPAIIIGTPGRITDHLSKGNFNPETIHTLIIDEFDKSLEFGFHDEVGRQFLPLFLKRVHPFGGILLCAYGAKFVGFSEYY